MKYRNKVQSARKKYLEVKELSIEDQTIIEQDFKGKDYQYYETNADKHLLLANEYSAEATYRQIEGQLNSKPKPFSKSILKYASSIAAACLLAVVSLYIYQMMGNSSLITMSTTYGEQKEIQLPDGSIVTLNSLSSITYNQNLEGDQREVSLVGEAYFDVAKNPTKPFVVNAEEISIKVLGTKFNITAYENEDHITTSLLEGSVSVNTSDGHIHILEPNDQSVYSKRAKTVQLRNNENIVSQTLWIKGQLFFDNEPLREILKTLEREKHITLKLSNSTLATLHITANFDREDSIEDILNVLAESGDFTYSASGSTYTIKE